MSRFPKPSQLRTIILTLLAVLPNCQTLRAEPPSDRALPAFPGAEGFGAATLGGRGGKVLEVTNLNDNGSGSFRAACEAEGPRTVVFRTGGTITVGSSIRIRDPFITIAGQTAPGDGIMLKADPRFDGPVVTVDERVVNDVRNTTGRCIDAPSDVGGWPVLQEGTPPTDADHDGMPDHWEAEQGLDPSDPEDRNRTNLSQVGYTNLETYLNGLFNRKVVEDTAPMHP